MKVSCKRSSGLLSSVLFLALLIPSLTLADSATKQCVLNARENLKSCSATCRETFNNERTTCGVNPDCHRSCNDALDTCKDPYDKALESCIDSCNEPLEAARETCRTSIGCGASQPNGACFQNAEYRACLRGAILAKVTCALDCRDAQRTNPDVINALRACTLGARACHKACRVLPTPPVK